MLQSFSNLRESAHGVSRTLHKNCSHLMSRGISAKEHQTQARKQRKFIDGNVRAANGAARCILDMQCPRSLHHRGSVKAQLHNRFPQSMQRSDRLVYLTC